MIGQAFLAIPIYLGRGASIWVIHFGWVTYTNNKVVYPIAR